MHENKINQMKVEAVNEWALHYQQAILYDFVYSLR